MARRPRNGDSDDNRRKRPANGDRGSRGGGYGGGQGGSGEPERGEAGEHQIFEDMVQRRMGGGAPPSAAAYARALRLWQQMPGAIGFTPVPDLPDEPPPEGPPDGEGDGQPKPPGDGGSGEGGVR
jgi:hypothetical protein